MAVLTFPSLTPTNAEFGQLSNTQSFTSPLSGTTQTLEMPGAHWHLKMAFGGLSDAERRLLQAFLAQCRGQAGRFYYGDPAFLINGPSGSIPGTPLIDGAAQSGTTLNTKGWTPSQSNILKAGDYFHYTNGSSGREMHMVVADANSDGSGLSALSIEPAIRVAPDDAAAITVTNAMCQMRLVDNNQTSWGLSLGLAGGVGTIAIEAVEAFTDAA